MNQHLLTDDSVEDYRTGMARVTDLVATTWLPPTHHRPAPPSPT